MDYQTYTLANGIRIIHKQVPSIVGHCGMIINTGSRDEAENEHGMAHFIEHALFKGTTKRNAYNIISRLEDVGGEMNAYTTKEETCIYATFLKKDYSRAFELLSDLVFHSTFPEKELKKEKEVIIDEINSYKDDPAELIFDDFEELIFKNQPIGRNILGNSKNLHKFKSADIIKFIKNNYHTDEMVFASIDDIPFEKIKKLCIKYLSEIPANLRKNHRIKFNGYQPVTKIVEKNTFQCHCMIGNLAYEVKDDRRVALNLLCNILGGPGLNSRLGLALREHNGIAYNIEASYSPYSDTGVLNVYFGTDKGNIEKSIDLAHKEFKKLKTQKLGTLQLSKAKKQMTGQLAIASESNENVMLNMARSYMIFNKVDSLEEINKKVDAITSTQLLDIANEILDENKLSTLIFK